MFRNINNAYPSGFTCGEQNITRTTTKLDITTSKASGQWIDKSIFPQNIVVRAKVLPVNINNKNISATLQYNNEVLTAEKLYSHHANSENSDVRIKLLSLEKYQDGKKDEFTEYDEQRSLLKLPNEQIFTKIFHHQKIDILEHFSTNEMKSYLWGFGGYLKPGCNLSEVEQIFFELGIHNKKTAATQVTLSRISKWQKIGLEAGKNLQKGDLIKTLQKGIEADAFLSLADHIVKGDVSCQLQLKDTTNLKQIYQSYKYTTLSSNSHIYEIHFKK